MISICFILSWGTYFFLHFHTISVRCHSSHLADHYHASFKEENKFSFALLVSSADLRINVRQVNRVKKNWFCIYKSLTYMRRRQWHPTPVLFPGISHGRRSLVGCRPWGREESDTTERLHFHFSLSCIGEGNGNPLQCSCLENPRDGGAWWAAVYGVA